MVNLILVDSNDNEIGYGDKEKTHYEEPQLHRAFSTLIFNSKGQMLIQKRDSSKETWPGFWSNACCSHPQKGEDITESAKKRLEDELGFSCDLKFLFKFEYKAMYDEKWGEHELDHVFKGHYDGPVEINKDEVEDFKFVDIDELKEDVRKQPEKYTPWFLIILNKLYGTEADIKNTEWRILE